MSVTARAIELITSASPMATPARTFIQPKANTRGYARLNIPMPGLLATAALGDGKPAPIGGKGGLGGLKPLPVRPTIPGSFGKPKPPKGKNGSASVLKYLKA